MEAYKVIKPANLQELDATLRTNPLGSEFPITIEENLDGNDIAKRANVSEGTVYSFFKTKEGILNAIVSEFMDEIIPNIIFD